MGAELTTGRATDAFRACDFDPLVFRSSHGVTLASWQRALDHRRRAGDSWELRAFALELRAAWEAAEGAGASRRVCACLGLHRSTLARWATMPTGPAVETGPQTHATGAPAHESAAAEARAIRAIWAHLDALADAPRRRVLITTCDRYGVTTGGQTVAPAHRSPMDYEPPGIATDVATVKAAREVAAILGSAAAAEIHPRHGVPRLTLWADGGKHKPACDVECVRPARGGDGACPRAPKCLEQLTTTEPVSE